MTRFSLPAFLGALSITRKRMDRLIYFWNAARNLSPPMKTVLQISVCSIFVSLFASCQSCKIEPPLTGVDADKQVGAKAAANALTTAVSGGSAEVNYHNVVKKTYATVGQDDVAFYLLMQAYNCESARRHTAAAQEILSLARQELARRHEATPLAPGIAVGSTMLTPTEKKVLKNSSQELKEEVKKTIATPKAVHKRSKKAKPTPSPTAKPSSDSSGSR